MASLKSIAFSLLALALSAISSGCASSNWKQTLHSELPRMGHRNWIVIADSAYPWQTSGGITTTVTGADQIEVVKAVLAEIESSRHVRPIIYTDSELPFVPENRAPGIDAYRQELGKVLEGKNVQSIPHEQIIAKLDEGGKLFHVLLLKTNLAVPYTSVFINLDCGYWSAEAQKELTEAIQKSGKK